MFSAFKKFGKLGALASSVARAWSPLALWPDGVNSPGMWIDPSLLTASFDEYEDPAPVAVPGTVADYENPVGLALDIRAGATVLTDPGNHMLQASTTPRPLESALVNLVLEKAVIPLNSSTDMTGGFSGGVSVSFSGGVNTLTRQTGADSFARWSKAGDVDFQNLAVSAPITFTCSVRGVGSAIGRSFALKLIRASTVTSYVTLTGDWVTVDVASPPGAPEIYAYFLLYGDSSTANVEVGESVEVKDLQVNYGGSLTYQAVDSASSYTSTGITPFQLYDGVDDGMATASFAAGTLTSSMDCMIAVRRDSAAQVVFASDASDEYFGYCVDGSADANTYAAGSPTVWVDGVQLAGGTTVSAGTIHTALTVGDWHILEFRGLDLSAWTSFCFSKYYAGYNLNGARGDIMLYPSTASTEDKDAARQYLADKYGVTLA